MAQFDTKLCEKVQKYRHIYDSSIPKDVIRVSNSWIAFQAHSALFRQQNIRKMVLIFLLTLH